MCAAKIIGYKYRLFPNFILHLNIILKVWHIFQVIQAAGSIFLKCRVFYSNDVTNRSWLSLSMRQFPCPLRHMVQKVLQVRQHLLSKARLLVITVVSYKLINPRKLKVCYGSRSFVTLTNESKCRKSSLKKIKYNIFIHTIIQPLCKKEPIQYKPSLYINIRLLTK